MCKQNDSVILSRDDKSRRLFWGGYANAQIEKQI
jgi:hypothetical protein